MKYVLVVLVVLGIVIVVGCGGGAASTITSTTAAAGSATTTVVPTTTLPTTTGAPTTTTLSENAKVTQYAAAMEAFAKAFGEWTSTLVDTPDDVTKLTDADVQNSLVALDRLHALSDQLHGIQPPAALAAVHKKLVDALDALVTSSSEAMAAAVSRDQAAYDAANTETEKAGTAFGKVIREWQAALQLALPSG